MKSSLSKDDSSSTLFTDDNCFKQESFNNTKQNFNSKSDLSSKNYFQTLKSVSKSGIVIVYFLTTVKLYIIFFIFILIIFLF